MYSIFQHSGAWSQSSVFRYKYRTYRNMLQIRHVGVVTCKTRLELFFCSISCFWENGLISSVGLNFDLRWTEREKLKVCDKFRRRPLSHFGLVDEQNGNQTRPSDYSFVMQLVQTRSNRCKLMYPASSLIVHLLRLKCETALKSYVKVSDIWTEDLWGDYMNECGMCLITSVKTSHEPSNGEVCSHENRRAIVWPSPRFVVATKCFHTTC